MYKMSSSDGLKAYDTVSDTQRCCEIPCKKVRQSFFMVLHLFVQTKSDRRTCVLNEKVQTLLVCLWEIFVKMSISERSKNGHTLDRMSRRAFQML